MSFRVNMNIAAPLSLCGEVRLSRVCQRVLNQMCGTGLRVRLANICCLCRTLIYKHFLRRAFRRFYQKFIETAYPTEDIYLE